MKQELVLNLIMTANAELVGIAINKKKKNIKHIENDNQVNNYFLIVITKEVSLNRLPSANYSSLLAKN